MPPPVGVGLMACQWAASEGIRLIGTAGTEDKCRLALDHGAEACINYRDKDWVAEVKDLTGGKGVDVVMDAVGADTFEGSLNSLKPLGMMISFGNASGPVPPFNIATLAQKGSLKITRPTLFTHIADAGDLPEMARELFEKVTIGRGEDPHRPAFPAGGRGRGASRAGGAEDHRPDDPDAVTP
jgi:NADPH2:quinone reductase